MVNFLLLFIVKKYLCDFSRKKTDTEKLQKAHRERHSGRKARKKLLRKKTEDALDKSKNEHGLYLFFSH